MTYPNLARDPEVVERVQREVIGTIIQVRDNRVRLEEKWQRFYRIWNGELDKNSYQGRSKIFLMAARATCETWQSAISRDFYPSTDDWYSIDPIQDIGDELRADALKAAFDYFFQRKQKLKSDSLPGFRQLVTYGTAPFKEIFEDKETDVIALKRSLDQFGKVSMKKESKKYKTAYGPRVLPIDLFNFYVWPETALDVQAAELAFQDYEVTVAHIKQMAKTPMGKDANLGFVYEVPDEVYLDIGQSNVHRDLYRFRRERLQRMGLSADPSDRWNKLSVNRRNLTEMYWRKDLDGTGEKEWLITLVNDFFVIRIQENPYWHKRKPFLVPRLIRVVNEFYGRGVMEVIDRVQYMMNDIVNQSMDSVQYELNPIVIIDPGAVAFPNSIRVHPGAKWLGDHTGIEFTKPASVASIGFATLNMLQGYIQDFSGANAAQQGQPAARGRGRVQNTATGMTTILQQGSMGISQVIEDLEQQFGEPMLEMAYSLLEQFFDDKIMMRILGRRGAPLLQKEIDITDIIGDYEFRWQGSVALRNRQVMGQQMINFLNIARGFPPEVMQQLNWNWLIKKVWTEGLGLRNAEEMFNPTGWMFSVDPALEYRLSEENRDIVVSPGDDHQAHLKQHYTDRAMIEDPIKLKKWDMHIQGHMEAIQKAIQEQQQQQMIQQMMQAQQAQPGGNGGARPQNMPSGLEQNPLAALMSQTQSGGGGQS